MTTDPDGLDLTLGTSSEAINQVPTAIILQQVMTVWP